MFEENTKQVNQILSRLFIRLSPAILALAALSFAGVFEFGTTYCVILIVTGFFTAFTPSLLIRHLSPDVLKHYMITTVALFIGILATNNKIGVNITYLLAPLFSCLYFDQRFVLHSSAFSYVIMVAALYINSASKLEVTLQGRDRFAMFVAYTLGYTIEYVVVVALMIFLVRRARLMMEQRHDAEEANRMKSQFLSSMSHEIRTPMNAIIGMADVALREEMTPELRKCINIIHSSSTGLLEIINDILDLSRVEAGKMKIMDEPYSTADLAEEMQAIVNARNLDHHVPIYYHIQPGMPPYLRGDSVRLRQIMLNFASNAIKYTDTGRIDITLGCTPVQDGQTELMFSVKDTGQGILPEDMDKLFTLYSQFNPRQNHGKESSGIGLAVCKAFADAMGGTIKAESTFGEGSTFAFSVPQKLSDAPAAPAEDPTGPTASFTARGVRALIVGDNDINREVLKALLEPLQMTLEEAADGQQAVARAACQPYDLIFMDSHMPVMTGEEATRAIRSTEGPNQGTPIIALTADAIAGVREQLLQSGMNDYLVKPINVDTLCAVILRHLPADRIQPAPETPTNKGGTPQ